jgi:hypothetical protein
MKTLKNTITNIREVMENNCTWNKITKPLKRVLQGWAWWCIFNTTRTAETGGLWPAQAKVQDPMWNIAKAKKRWGCGSSGRTLA